MKIPEVDFEKKPEPKKKEKDRYPNPVIIVNLSQEEMNKYFKRKGCFGSNNIKYQTFNDKLLDKCSFYFDEKLTNYYKEDFEAFKKKFKLIQCKYPSRSKQLIKAVNNARKFNEDVYVCQNSNYSLNQIKKYNSTSNLFRRKDITNTFFPTAIYPKIKKTNQSENLQYITNKENNVQQRLFLRTYDERDNQLRIFHNLEERVKEKNGYTFQMKNDENIDTSDVEPFYRCFDFAETGEEKRRRIIKNSKPKILGKNIHYHSKVNTNYYSSSNWFSTKAIVSKRKSSVENQRRCSIKEMKI